MRRSILSVFCLSLVLVTLPLADADSLRSRQQRLASALDKVTPALVAVRDNFGAGSGVVVSRDGIVLTASHVVDSRQPQRQRIRVVFADGKEYSAKLLGMNRSVDAAMLKITDAAPNGSGFPFAELGDSRTVERGDWCFALGHPGGFRSDRPAPVRLGRILSTGYRTIVSDCAIVLGDSGGPLFDLSGKVIGIHSMITEVIVENRHVAIDCFRRDGDRMEGGETWGNLKAHDTEVVESGFVGARLRWRSFTPEVSHVLRDSPSAEADIRPGDILLSIANQTFADPLGLSNLLDEIAENQKVDVVVDRNGDEITLPLTTGRKPSREELRRLDDRTVAVEDREHFLELKNQLTSLRHVGPYEKRSIEQLQLFEPVLKGKNDCVVEFRVFGQTTTLGTIMTSDGYILTKASELEKVASSRCVLPTGKSLRPRLVGIDYAYDLMLVKVEATGLQPADWSRELMTPGRIVITTDSRGAPILPGVISVATRKLPTSGKGFLGVAMNPLRDRTGREIGVEIGKVFEGGAAKRSGVLAGDRVLEINEESIRSRRRMLEIIQSVAPNQRIALKVQRGDAVEEFDVVLTPRFLEEVGDVMLDRYGDPDQLGKFASAHNSGFPQALQHDTDLYPKQCGGPLFDISGRAVGLNIARAARITSYAIPAGAVQKVFEQLKAKDEEAEVRKAS